MASGLSGTHPNVTQCLCKPLTPGHVSHTVFALYFLALQLSCSHGLGKACSLAGGRLVAIKAACLGPTFLAHLTTRRKAKTYSILEEVKAVYKSARLGLTDAQPWVGKAVVKRMRRKTAILECAKQTSCWHTNSWIQPIHSLRPL